ncbi:MAG: DUF1778 domain-containing protein [Alphaproteobacteria bacterium]|nr:DUF1778 domain-containing protein [Pseudomonadota bacterium]TDI64231.1 MAG: DUF1778 domain-containing protein [Alphaproteobacteria bacterium]
MAALDAVLPSDERKQERVNVRLSSSVKSTLEYAAAVSGRSVSDFIVSSALRAAHEAIENHERMKLIAEDRVVFMRALSKPPAPNKALRDAAKSHKKILK